MVEKKRTINRFSRRFLLPGVALIVIGMPVTWWLVVNASPDPWSAAETETLQSLWIGSLTALAPDPSNAVADDYRAAWLGQQFFFDERLSTDGTVSCATCHQPERRFTDGLQKGQAIGMSKRNTPSIVGVAYSPWFFWDGRSDSLWSQALVPLEDTNEHGGSRMQYVHLVVSDASYKLAYEELFGRLPDLSDPDRYPENATPLANGQWNTAWQSMTEADRQLTNEIYSNIGKSVAAYERLLMPGQSRFDDYVESVMSGDDTAQHQLFSDDEIKGLRLFIGEANCTQCHNGPLLTNHEFHNTGVVSFPGEVPDKGRVQGVRLAKLDPFNCLGGYGHPDSNSCAELRYARTGAELIGTMKTPSLRNLEGTDPYMHKGQLASIAEVLDNYNRAPLAMIGHNEAEPLNLSGRELRQLASFLETLAAPIAIPAEWLVAPDKAQIDNL